jgi:hypothetical protein
VIGRDVTARARSDSTLSVAGHLPVRSVHNFAESNRSKVQLVVRELSLRQFIPSDYINFILRSKFQRVSEERWALSSSAPHGS